MHYKGDIYYLIHITYYMELGTTTKRVSLQFKILSRSKILIVLFYIQGKLIHYSLQYNDIIFASKCVFLSFFVYRPQNHMTVW